MRKREKLKRYHFSDEEKAKLKDEIIAFFGDEMDQEMGMIGADRVLDFFMDTMGEAIYNKALDNALSWHKQAMGNLEADYYSLYQE